MIFSDRTIEILKNFSEINQSISFDVGNVIRTISPPKTILARAEISEYIDTEFAIFNLPRFLNTMSLMGSPNITISDKSVILVGEGKKVTYGIAPKDNIVTPPANDIVSKDVVLSFKLKQSDLQNVLKAKAILNLPEIAFVGEESKIKMRAFHSSDPTSDVYDVDVGETNFDFFVTYKSENFRFLPNDYDVEVSRAFVTKFTSKDVAYWIAAQSTSSTIGR